MADPAPPIVRTVRDLRTLTGGWKRAGETIAMVPTMGALHEGHISLVRLARERASRVVASIFVNPTQFGPNEDFERYPRSETRDATLLGEVGCDLIFAPTVDEMYAPGFSTAVTVRGVSEPLDGAARPGHFEGVATVVTKLLVQCGPDLAVFGEKDYQQLQVIRRLVKDLDLPVEILGAPTARDADGLALSSRNAYLTSEQRQAAPALHQALQEAARRLKAGESVERIEATGRAALERAGFSRIDYFELRDAETLARPDESSDRPKRLLAAAWLGRTRLIDNVAAS